MLPLIDEIVVTAYAGMASPAIPNADTAMGPAIRFISLSSKRCKNFFCLHLEGQLGLRSFPQFTRQLPRRRAVVEQDP
jgi:hypothetical protein